MLQTNGLKTAFSLGVLLCITGTNILSYSWADEQQITPTKQLETPKAKAPLWSELCPGIYCASSTIEIPEALPYASPGLTVLAVFVPIFAPMAIIREKKAKERNLDIRKALSQNYWVQRRGEFEREIAQCQQINDNDKLVSCYMDIRKNEANKNQARRQEMLMIEQVNSLYSLRFH